MGHFVDEYRPEDEVLSAARQRGDEIGARSIAPATGATLQWLAETVRARTVAEVGTGAGVSGLWLLRGTCPRLLRRSDYTSQPLQTFEKNNQTDVRLQSQGVDSMDGQKFRRAARRLAGI